MNSRQTLMPAKLSEGAKSRKAKHEEGSLFDFKRRSNNQTLWYLWFPPFQMVCSSQTSPPFTTDSELPFKWNHNGYKKTLPLLVSRKHSRRHCVHTGSWGLKSGPSWLLVWGGQARKSDTLHLDHATRVLIWCSRLCQSLLPCMALTVKIFTEKHWFLSIGLPFS